MYFQRLKDLREDKGLTQTDIGKLLHIRQNVYSRYKIGYPTLSIKYLMILADFYDTSAYYILGRTNDIKPYPKKVTRFIT